MTTSYSPVSYPGMPGAIVGQRLVGRTLVYYMKQGTFRGCVIVVGEDTGDDVSYFIRLSDTERRENATGARWTPCPQNALFGFFCGWTVREQPRGRLQFLSGDVVCAEVLPADME